MHSSESLDALSDPVVHPVLRAYREWARAVAQLPVCASNLATILRLAPVLSEEMVEGRYAPGHLSREGLEAATRSLMAAELHARAALEDALALSFDRTDPGLAAHVRSDLSAAGIDCSPCCALCQRARAGGV